MMRFLASRRLMDLLFEAGNKADGRLGILKVEGQVV